MTRVLRSLLLLVLLGGMGGASPAHAQTNRPEVTRIEFTGNQVFDDDALKAAIANRESGCRLIPLFCWFGIDAARDRRYLQPRELPLDATRIQAYYLLRGYREVEVDTALVRDNGTVGIEFRIREGEPVLVEQMEVAGLEEVEVEGLQDDLPLAVGDPLSAIQIQAVKDTLVSRLREVGYAHAVAFSGFFIPSGTRAAQVNFDVDPGPLARFGPVSVSWLPGPGGEVDPELDETSVRRMVPFREGGLYRYSQLVQGQRNLYSLELIRTARVRTLGDTLVLDSIIPVAIEVGEGNLHRVRAGGGWSTADCLSAEAQWASRNWRGGARRLTIRGRLSNILAPELNDTEFCSGSGTGDFARLNGQLSVELVQPWVFSPRNSLTLNAFLERQSLPDVFIREALGYTLALSRNLGRGTTATLAYQPALTRLDAGEVFFCASFLLCADRDIQVFEAANWLSPVVLSLALNRSNRVLNPTAGYSLGVDLEHASRFTRSDFSYNRIVGEITAYAGLGEETVLAARFRGGLVNPGIFEIGGGGRSISHPQKRFYSGGAGSVRGYGENRLGPRVLSVDVERLLEHGPEGRAPVCTPEAVADGSCDALGASQAALNSFVVRPTGGDALLEANLELRFPFIADALQGALFVDVGQVWSRDDNENITVDLGALEFSPGVGIRYFSPIGPIRLDVGYRFRGADDLPLLTAALVPCAGGAGCDQIRVRGPDGEAVSLPWAASNDLQRLATPVPFGGVSGGRFERFLKRLQLHLSIGQPF